MTFPLTIGAIVVLVVAFWYGLKLAAEAGDKRAAEHLRKLRDATPPHEYMNHDGSRGNWP